MGVGVEYSDFRITPIRCESKPKWAKLIAGLTGPKPLTYIKTVL